MIEWHTREEANHSHSRAEEDAEYYDGLFRKGGFEGVYDLPYRHSAYYPLFRAVLKALRRNQARKVLEVGCGTGALAHMLAEHAHIDYRGFDFSSVAVDKAVHRLGASDPFAVGDALDPASYVWDYDTIVCTEVLEHIDRDREAMSLWREGALCICSVPDFDAQGHVRHFRSEAEVQARYGDLVRIESIDRVRKPFLTDLSWANRWRELRWNRYRPHRLLQILNLGYLNDLGSWFIFVGRKM